MKIAHSDIMFFRTYTKPTYQKLGHQSSKRDFWLKSHAPTSAEILKLEKVPKNKQKMTNSYHTTSQVQNNTKNIEIQKQKENPSNQQNAKKIPLSTENKIGIQKLQQETIQTEEKRVTEEPRTSTSVSDSSEIANSAFYGTDTGESTKIPLSTENNIGIKKSKQETIQTKKRRVTDKQRTSTSVSDSSELDNSDITGIETDERTKIPLLTEQNIGIQKLKQETNQTKELRVNEAPRTSTSVSDRREINNSAFYGIENGESTKIPLSIENNIGIKKLKQETIQTEEIRVTEERTSTSETDSSEIDNSEDYGIETYESKTSCKVRRAKTDTQKHSERNVRNEIRRTKTIGKIVSVTTATDSKANESHTKIRRTKTDIQQITKQSIRYFISENIQEPHEKSEHQTTDNKRYISRNGIINLSPQKEVKNIQNNNTISAKYERFDTKTVEKRERAIQLSSHRINTVYDRTSLKELYNQEKSKQEQELRQVHTNRKQQNKTNSTDKQQLGKIIKIEQKLNRNTSLLQLIFPTLSAKEERKSISKRHQTQQVLNQSERRNIAVIESAWNTKPLPIQLYQAHGTKDYIDIRPTTKKGELTRIQKIENIPQEHKSIEQVLTNIRFSQILKSNTSNNSTTQNTENIRQYSKPILNPVVRNHNIIVKTQKIQAQINLNKAVQLRSGNKHTENKVNIIDKISKQHPFKSIQVQIINKMHPYTEKKGEKLERLSFQQMVNEQNKEETERVTKEKTCIAPPSPAADGAWTEVKETKAPDEGNSKRKESDVYPINLPEESYPTPNDSHHINLTNVGVTIYLKLPNAAKENNNRFVQAMLLCMKLKDPYTTLIPYEYRKDLTNIKTSDILSEVKTEDTEIDFSKYMEGLVRKRNIQEFTARLVFQTSMPMIDILSDIRVKDWLKQERIRCEINNLVTPNPYNVGFLILTLPKYDAIQMYTERLQNVLSDESPEFHLLLTPVFPERPKNSKEAKANPLRFVRSHVLMIRAALYDIEQLNKALQQLHEVRDIIYRPWKEYLSLSTGQKRTIILEQEKFIKNHKIFTIDKINTSAQLLPMHSVEDNIIDPSDIPNITKETNMDLQSATILDFLIHHYKAGDGKRLFTYVFTPIADKIEVVVSKDHVIEAKHCLETIHIDLQYFCNTATIEQTFDAITIQETSLQHYSPWKPYTYSTMVVPTPAPEPTQTNTKRRKTTTDIAHNKAQKSVERPVPTYASVSANKKRSNDSIITQVTQTSGLTTTLVDDKEAQKASKHIIEIKTILQNQETKLQALEKLITKQTHEVETIIDRKIETAASKQDRKIKGIIDTHSDELLIKFTAMLRTMATKSSDDTTDDEHVDMEEDNYKLNPRKRITKDNAETYCYDTDISDENEIEFE